MKQKLTLVFASSLLILMAMIGGSASASVFDPQSEPGAKPSDQQSPATEKQEVAGKIEAVDADRNVVQVEGTSVPIVATNSTRYSRGLSFSSLKPGMQVRIVAVLRSDGRLEALEVRSA
ncbi:DUF5666 domain-containing protein [uncultured Paludibaculum sp.]|uniref:DUF5666 domain-containing protein n=1 Tax=uncultured Paludibaculum sp. TaxID=1765020 RepID=UPI002AABEC1B|nr:DUF5666 domain-containing protein [uncultured Paludibaculum sp.]